MEQLKVLYLLIVGIIITSECNFQTKAQQVNLLCRGLIVRDSAASVAFAESEYEISDNVSGYKLVFQHKKKLELIKHLNNPEIEFCINNKTIISKGNYIYSSSVPENAYSFFAITEQKKIYLFNNNTILLTMVKK